MLLRPFRLVRLIQALPVIPQVLQPLKGTVQIKVACRLLLVLVLFLKHPSRLRRRLIHRTATKRYLKGWILPPLSLLIFWLPLLHCRLSFKVPLTKPLVTPSQTKRRQIMRPPILLLTPLPRMLFPQLLLKALRGLRNRPPHQPPSPSHPLSASWIRPKQTLLRR